MLQRGAGYGASLRQQKLLLIRKDLGELLDGRVENALFVVVIDELDRVQGCEVAASDHALVDAAWSHLPSRGLGRLDGGGFPVILSLVQLVRRAALVDHLLDGRRLLGG